MYERINVGGTYCSLVTGQEQRRMPFANHVACTVEMVDLGKQMDVGVVDEIQMMADPVRGWAWTRALYG